MDIENRLAIVETKVEQIKEDLHQHMRDHTVDKEALLARMETMHKELMAEIAPIKADWQKYKGAAGMAVLIASILWAGVIFFKDQIMAALK